MLEGLDQNTEARLTSWLKESIRSGSNQLGEGYQGALYLFHENDMHLLIKVAKGNFLTRPVHEFMLRKERNVYRAMQGLDGVPKCYGMLNNKYLVLEFIAGTPIRHAEITDRAFFFNELLALIRTLHARGVAHGDMKKQDNLLVVDGKHPCLIDFGVAIVRKKGFAPFNHYYNRVLQKFDFNAWIKLKYQGRYDEITEEDSHLWQRTWLEKVARAIKFKYLVLKRMIIK